jgi:hypothetical protein
MMTQESRRLAGILLIVLPTVEYGGYFLLTQIITPRSGYVDNPLRQNLFRAGHAHAGVLLVLSLVALRYVDEANLSEGWKRYVRSSVPSAAVFLPAAFFFSVVSPRATAPNGFIYLAYLGAIVLAKRTTGPGSRAFEEQVETTKSKISTGGSSLHWGWREVRISLRAPGSA